MLARVASLFFFFFFNDTATTEIYPLSLHDALPIFLDRIDLAVEVQPATAAELSHAPRGEPSSMIAERVNRGRLALRDRHGPTGPPSNAEVESDAIQLAPDAMKLVEEAMNRLRLS